MVVVKVEEVENPCGKTQGMAGIGYEARVSQRVIVLGAV